MQTDAILMEKLKRIADCAKDLDKHISELCMELNKRGLPYPGQVREDGTIIPPQLEPCEYAPDIAKKFERIVHESNELQRLIMDTKIGTMSRASTLLVKDVTGPRSLQSVNAAGGVDTFHLRQYMDGIRQVCDKTIQEHFPSAQPEGAALESKNSHVGDFRFCVPDEKRHRTEDEQGKES